MDGQVSINIIRKEIKTREDARGSVLSNRDSAQRSLETAQTRLDTIDTELTDLYAALTSLGGDSDNPN